MNKLRNPVLISGIKIRMRSLRSYILISISIILLLIIFAGIYNTTTRYQPSSYTLMTVKISLGKTLYTTIAFLLFGLTLLVVPGMTSGLITGEREKQTLDLLLCTPMSGFGIVWGKLFSALSYYFVVLLACYPLITIAYLYGGISMFSTLSLMGFLITMAFGSGAVGIFFSSFCKKTSVAAILSYGFLIIYGVGTLIFGMTHTNYVQGMLADQGVFNSNEYVSMILLTNPVIGLGAMLSKQMGVAGFDFLNYFGFYGAYTIFDPRFSGIIPLISMGVIFIISIVMIIFSSICIKPINKFSFSGKKKKIIRSKNIN